MKETLPPGTSMEETEKSIIKSPVQTPYRNGVTLRKIQSAYELQIKPKNVPQANLFPARKSNYIGHLRNQAFVNNVRLRFLSDDSNVPARCAPKRSQSAPIFSTNALKKLAQQPINREDDRCLERKCKSASHHRSALSGSQEYTKNRIQTANTTKSAGCLETRRSISLHKYYGKLGNGTKNAKIYPDTNGVFFKVIGSGIKPPYSNGNQGSYISMLTNKDFKKTSGGSDKKATPVNSTDNDSITKERLDYERQTHQLLQYYTSKPDGNQGKGFAVTKPINLTEYQAVITPSPVSTPRDSAIPETPQTTTPVCTTDRRSEYFLHLNYKRKYGRAYVPASPFLVISRQAVLHDKKSCFDQTEGKVNCSLSKKCHCSVCQSDLNLDTSRLTLSPVTSMRTVAPSNHNRQYWVNPSGPLDTEDLKRQLDADYLRRKLEESDSVMLEEHDFTRHSEENIPAKFPNGSDAEYQPMADNFTRPVRESSLVRRPISPLNLTHEYLA